MGTHEVFIVVWLKPGLRPLYLFLNPKKLQVQLSRFIHEIVVFTMKEWILEIDFIHDNVVLE